jgi:chromosome segregation ATPase
VDLTKAVDAYPLESADASAVAPSPEEARSDVDPVAADSSSSSSSLSGGDFLDMRQKIVDLEGRVSSLTKEKDLLDEELKSVLNDSADERLSVSSDNWNLERATMRFNEAERQIARLGRELQTQKAQCNTEKQKLEGMLFDPEVTNQQQLSRLSELEGQLEEIKSKSAVQQRTYEERIRILEGQLRQR